MLLKEKRSGMPYIITVSLIVVLLLWLAARTFGQTNTIVQNEIAKSEIQKAAKKTDLQPVFAEYKGVTIGTPVDELLERINEKPRFEDKDGYFYVFSDEESAQFILDADKKVKLMSITYSGKGSNAPTYEDVFGKDVPVKTNPDGKIYNLINYPKAGFWVAYYNTMGDDPTVTITIQKL